MSPNKEELFVTLQSAFRASTHTTNTPLLPPSTHILHKHPLSVTSPQLMDQSSPLLQRYRNDRRKLIQFLLSSELIKEVRTPSGPTTSLSSIDFDCLSADFILHSIQSGGVIDVSEASKKYADESDYPVMIHSQNRNSYFLVSDPDVAGSPPRRAPPVKTDKNDSASRVSSRVNQSHFESVITARDELNTEMDASFKPVENSEIPPLGLPKLNTGLSDDDLRESAYELLLATMFLSGVEEHSSEDRKEEKSSKLLSRLKSKRDKMRPRPQPHGKHLELVDTVRVQMQISEAMDACIRRNLMQLAARRTGGRIDLPDISLGLMNGIFKSDFPNEKSYLQWKNRQANLLEEILCACASATETEHATVRSCVAKIKDVKEWDTTMSPSERVAVLASIRQVVLKLSSLPGRFGVQGETCYWTGNYHLNIRLYEKLLFGVFDVLDEGQLIEEADDFLLLIKLTWSALGITPVLHRALYVWVLFQQFVVTDEGSLLDNAVNELQKVLPSGEDGRNEGQYVKSLICSRKYNGSELKLNMVQAIFLSIGIWCDGLLHDYHLHFSKRPSNFRMMMTLVSVVGVPDDDEFKLIKLNSSDENAVRKLKTYVKDSIEAACWRATRKIDVEYKTKGELPLALLAKELKLIAEREFNVFWPVLRQLNPESLINSVVLLRHFYGERLKPFLKEVSSLTEDARSVLPAADELDHYLTQLYTSALDSKHFTCCFNQDLEHYQIGELSKPIILDWVISQHSHILEWSGRAFDIEEWEPLSFHQRQSASIVEVFRIIEETVDQFFGLNLPMDITHLQALLSIIFHCLDSYLMKMLNQLVDKSYLYPPTPPLTRYTEATIQILRKKLLEQTHLDDDVAYKLDALTIPKNCIRLNTLQYIQKQVSSLEDGIRNSWALVRPSDNLKWAKEDSQEENSLTCGEAVDALFTTTFDVIKDTTLHAIEKICDFIGARAVFWDLRDTLLFQLYRGEVKNSRLENFIPQIDSVLDLICGLIDDTLRDRVVLNVCQATLEGFVWVLLDGGPSRAFSDSDIGMLEDDFNMLREFFVADGEGLPRSLVEQETIYAKQILHLFSLQTETVIQMLMNASERISMGLNTNRNSINRLEDANVFVRVLCHKKDREASLYLKRQYEFPMSSDYDDTQSGNSMLRSGAISDVLKRSTSVQWSKKGQSSFKSIKKKLHEATSEIRNVGR